MMGLLPHDDRATTGFCGAFPGLTDVFVNVTLWG